jgi:two-component system OmpR family response regulator
MKHFLFLHEFYTSCDMIKLIIYQSQKFKKETIMHILIIEDEEQLCRSMAEGLRMDGYETDTCFDGEEGLELCMTENYDLILLDLNLPGIDGLEILRQFRTFNTNTPVLILSARVQIQDKVEGLDLGANDYLTKPFHFEELEARIRSLTAVNLSRRMSA